MKSKRAWLWHRDKKKCHLCGKPVALLAATIDHLTPISAGGSNAVENLKIAHKGCNLARSNMGMFTDRCL